MLDVQQQFFLHIHSSMSVYILAVAGLSACSASAAAAYQIYSTKIKHINIVHILNSQSCHDRTVSIYLCHLWAAFKSICAIFALNIFCAIFALKIRY